MTRIKRTGLTFALTFVGFFIAPKALTQEEQCYEGKTTNDIEVCLMQIVKAEESQMEKYLNSAYKRWKGEKNLIEALKGSQKAWYEYRQAYCDAIYEAWSGGSIRGTKYALCMLRLTEQRTYTVWSDYLTYEDSTSPVLPEPELSSHSANAENSME